MRVSVVIDLEEQGDIAHGILRRREISTHLNVSELETCHTYTARMIIVGSRPAMTAPTRLQRSPRSHIATKKTLKPSPDLSL